MGIADVWLMEGTAVIDEVANADVDTDVDVDADDDNNDDETEADPWWIQWINRRRHINR